MPGIDGLESTKVIRELGYEEPIVALTANAVMGQMEMFMQNGFDGFISKPINSKSLNQHLLRFIRDKQSPEVIEAARQAAKNIDFAASGDISTTIINSFLRDAQKSMRLIESIIEMNPADWKDEHIKAYTIQTHGMKSALANIQKNSLSQVAGTLEQAGRDKNLTAIRTITPNFLGSLKDLIKELTPKEDMINISADDNSEDMEFMREKLDVIKDACENYNKKGAKNALDELNKRLWSRDAKELLNTITTHLLHSEFEEVVEIIDGFKG